MLVKPEIPAPSPVRPNGQKPKQVGLAYDPAMVFSLELATNLATRDSKTLAAFGKDVATALQGVVRDSGQMHPVVLSRAVYYTLRFLRASHVLLPISIQLESPNLTEFQDHDYIRVPVVLHTISKFDEEQTKQAAASIAQGLQLCLNGPVGLRNEMANSPDFWFILHALHSKPETAQPVFEIVEKVVTSWEGAMTTDNYDSVNQLLNEFATAGSIGAKAERRADEANARGRGQKPKTQR